MKKVILAFAGDMDSAICLHYLKNIKGFKVITFYAKFGQFDVHDIMIRSVQMGTEAAHVVDLTEKFIKNAVVPAIRSHIIYEDYYLSIALTRPFIMEEMIRIAKEERCEYISHGAHFMGNDFIRFRNLVSSLNKGLRIISPLQELGILTIDDAKKYAREEQLDIGKDICMEENIWGSSRKITKHSELKAILGNKASYRAKPLELKIKLKNSLPVAINNKNMNLEMIIKTLNEVAKPYGIGTKIAVEDVLQGIKEVYLYQSPAAEIIFNSISAMEKYVFDKKTLDIRKSMSDQYSQLIYEGKWFIPVREALDKFFIKTSKYLSGTVVIELIPRSVNIREIDSNYSML